MRASLITNALVASLIGYGSTIAVLLAAAAALGATPAQTASMVFAVCVAKGITSGILSFHTRVPVVLAWSTPGLALMAASTGISVPEAVGAFCVAASLVMLTGVWGPLGRLVQRIPDGLAAGMLAGVLLPFCLPLTRAVQDLPGLVLPMIAVFAIVRLKSPAMAVLGALATGIVLAFALGGAQMPPLALPLPQITLIKPELRASVLLGLGVPLYLVTMASQNLPGFAVQRAHGYAATVRPGLVGTGFASFISGFAGAPPISMAAITAAICLADDTHPDRSQRWKVGLAYGGIWVTLGLFSPLIIPMIAALPQPLIAALVALGLLGPLMGAAAGAFAVPDQRFAALVTLVTTASSVSFFGIGAAFWGLLAGIGIYAMERWVKKP
ncbi:benzoate membrane transport protein [Pseudorhodobacter antarcticus]|jgi:benzoate membrane transport protein|uniref:Benzoate membrane transport protein n=1 Tax=Pseudorhodobacter antarcticus TaxID=1077947 RepID=A0A1H8M3U7_9RHOB|nr:benzoate/H(+) symporter BenE family transporter [Pseudorhodobacter antarcticus]SEO11981.1 benzoate membrane transport protein [Pseudorhodobacter antarcticus]